MTDGHLNEDPERSAGDGRFILCSYEFDFLVDFFDEEIAEEEVATEEQLMQCYREMFQVLLAIDQIREVFERNCLTVGQQCLLAELLASFLDGVVDDVETFFLGRSSRCDEKVVPATHLMAVMVQVAPVVKRWLRRCVRKLKTQL